MCVDGLQGETNVAMTSRKWRHSSHLTPSQQPASGWYMAKIINVLTRQTHVDKKPPVGLEPTLFRRGKITLVHTNCRKSAPAAVDLVNLFVKPKLLT